MGALQQLHSEDRPCSEKKNICQLYGKMNYKIVLAFAIVVGVLVDCRSLERPNEDAVDHVIAKFTEMREAFQELAGSKEVTEDKVKQAIEQLETVDGFETVNETEQPREAEGGKRQEAGGIFVSVLLAILGAIAATETA